MKSMLPIVVSMVAGMLHLSAATRTSTSYTMVAETMDGGGGGSSAINYNTYYSVQPGTRGNSIQSVYEVLHGYFTTPTPALTIWDKWLAFNFPGETDEAIVGIDADWDGDFIPNVVEFAHGLDPLVGNGGGIMLDGLTMTEVGTPVVYVEAISTGVDFRGVFTRRIDYSEADLTYTPQFSHNLVEWFDSPDPVTVLDNDGFVELVSMPYMVFVPTPTFDRAKFFRVHIKLSDP